MIGAKMGKKATTTSRWRWGVINVPVSVGGDRRLSIPMELTVVLSTRRRLRSGRWDFRTVGCGPCLLNIHKNKVSIYLILVEETTNTFDSVTSNTIPSY